VLNLQSIHNFKAIYYALPMYEEKLAQLYGIKKHPIYIYAPAYLDVSAGIRALHYLCHSLNQMGYLSWMVIHGMASGDTPLVSPNLNTPVLNSEIRDLHFDNGEVPIVIYPETIPGNPLKAQVVVRWILNYPGALAGPMDFPDGERLIAYSKDISIHHGKRAPVLFLPALDIREIYSAKESSGNRPRTNRVLLYAGKYRGFVGNPILPRWAPKEITEIWREGPSKQSREEVLELLATSSCLFIFENSTLITESVLLGTPVILIKSTFFDSLIAENELGSNGTAWSDLENPIELALSTIEGAHGRYLESVDQFFSDLKKETTIWQEIASKSDYLSPIYLPNFVRLISRHRIRLAIQIFRSQGFLTLFRIVKSFIIRRISFKKN
jgi:hypothetical protein